MKIRPAVVSQAKPVAQTDTKPVTTAEPKKVETTFRGATQTATQKLTDVATKAATEAAMAGDHQHPLLEKFGEGLGLALGVIVTEALALSKEWNAPLKDASGGPVQHVEGADRVGDHDLRKRHMEVVGPKIEKYVESMKPGLVHELLEGLGRGATAAPGTSYRIEAKLSDWLHGASK